LGRLATPGCPVFGRRFLTRYCIGCRRTVFLILGRRRPLGAILLRKQETGCLRHTGGERKIAAKNKAKGRAKHCSRLTIQPHGTPLLFANVPGDSHGALAQPAKPSKELIVKNLCFCKWR
jgi:hypothetical protein